MMGGRIAPFALGALMLAGALVPVASGDHCQTKIAVYGRSTLTPVMPPPYTSYNQGICLRLLNGGVVDDHSVPPNTDQIMVRVNGDFGPSVTSLLATLEGFGYAGNQFTLERTPNQFGGYTYQLPEWLTLPHGLAEGNLTVTVQYPSGPWSVTYRASTNLVPPPLPPV